AAAGGGGAEAGPLHAAKTCVRPACLWARQLLPAWIAHREWRKVRSARADGGTSDAAVRHAAQGHQPFDRTFGDGPRQRSWPVHCRSYRRCLAFRRPVARHDRTRPCQGQGRRRGLVLRSSTDDRAPSLVTSERNMLYVAVTTENEACREALSRSHFALRLSLAARPKFRNKGSRVRPVQP